MVYVLNLSHGARPIGAKGVDDHLTIANQDYSIEELMNLDLWDIDDCVSFRKRFSPADPHDPIYLEEYLDDVPFVDDEVPSEVDTYDWFNEREPEEYDLSAR
jgi:hypothetical protein